MLDANEEGLREGWLEGAFAFPGVESSLDSSLRSPSVAPLVGIRARSGSHTAFFTILPWAPP
jgi:hypothetical protein